MQIKVDLAHDSDLADTLFELRRAWGSTIAKLGEACFDELAENYGGEDYEDALNAFSQELTIAGYQLYRISGDGVDSFVYAEEKETADFEKLLKKGGFDFQKLKQSGRKFGMPAKRNETKDCMAGIKFPESNENISFESFAGDYVYAVKYRKDNKASGGCVIDLRTNDRIMNEFAGIYLNVVYDTPSQTFAAWDSVHKCIVMGKDAIHPDQWSAVSPSMDRSRRLYWHNSDLFFGFGENLYVIKSAVKNDKCAQLLGGKSTYGEVDFVQLANGLIFASNYTELYSISKKALGGYTVKPHNFKFMKNGFLSFGVNDGDQILYCQPLVENGKIIVVLIRLDMESGQYSYAKLKHMMDGANIKDWDDDFWYVDGRLDPLIKGRDMAQFINKKTGEVYRIKAGALGKYRLADAVRLSDGGIVLGIAATGSSRLFKPDDFWGFLKEKNPAPEKLEWKTSDVLYPHAPNLK